MFQQRNIDENDDHYPSSYAPDAQFKRVFDKLPLLVEKKTGEEGEEILFKERCRLYRYDKDTNQWKERGVGDIKILFNDILNMYRVVMRREQVLKVCANHVINEKTEPKYHLGSSKTCSYFTLDYTAGSKPTAEQFAFRFKTEGMCRAYMDKIKEVKKGKTTVSESTPSTDKLKFDVSNVSFRFCSPSPPQSVNKFRLKSAISGTSQKTTEIPGSTKKITETESDIVTLNEEQTNAEVGKQSIFGDAMLNLASSGGFASFADMASGVQNVGFKKDPAFQFHGAGQVMFQQQSRDENDDHDLSSYASDTQFKPVLDKLPLLVEKKTGEEGEEILFKERCILYRYDKDTNLWKERGVGDIKILFNDIHNMYRVVMRREQVLKICANHVIDEKTEPKYHLGSSKTCSYFTLDYTDGPNPTPEQFAFRFKIEDMCKAYMDKIEDVKKLQHNEPSC
uniref:E3 SUMO-protein ligase RanBP2-like n=1 Tax=Styela clava TaxID=7725 RepID=UPI0019399517|nr:E3 SUMO-protein ligase RanBP2-like [Styela clava]